MSLYRLDGDSVGKNSLGRSRIGKYAVVVADISLTHIRLEQSKVNVGEPLLRSRMMLLRSVNQRHSTSRPSLTASAQGGEGVKGGGLRHRFENWRYGSCTFAAGYCGTVLYMWSM